MSNLWERNSTDDDASESNNNNDFVLPSLRGLCLLKGKVGRLLSDDVVGLRLLDEEKRESPSPGGFCCECSIFFLLSLIVDSNHNLSH